MIEIRARALGLLLSAAFLAPAANAADPVKIGVLLPTTGALAALSEDMIRGARLAVEEAGGSVGGRNLQLVIEDDEAKPAVGLDKAKKMILSDKVDILSGLSSSAVALAVTPYAVQRRTPVVIMLAGANELTGEKCSPWVYRLSYSSWQVAAPLGPWLAEQGKKRVFVLGSDYVSPREMVAGFRESFTKAGGTIIGEAWAPFGQTQDYGPYLAQAKAAKPDAIYAVFYGGEAILFVKQYDSFGMKSIPLTSPLGLVSSLLRGAQGPASADVISSVNYFAEHQSPENIAFNKKFREKFKAQPSEFSAFGYDTMRFIIEALKKTNGKTSDRQALLKAMKSVSFVGPRGPLRIDPKTNHAIQDVYVTKTEKRGDGVVAVSLATIKNVAAPAQGCSLK